jgi:flagellin-like protein
MKLQLPQNSEERGQVGIGVLIIFIALVLVAAVAAGVLINTSGLLQAQAEDTGADAQAQVSNQINIVSATGVVENGGVNETRLVVKKSSGADPIDLTQTTIQYTSDSARATLTYSDTGAVDANTFAVNTTAGDTATGEETILEDNNDRAVLVVSSDWVETGALDGDNLDAGEEVELQIVDQSGASTIYGVNVPDVLTGKDYVRV